MGISYGPRRSFLMKQPCILQLRATMALPLWSSFTRFVLGLRRRDLPKSVLHDGIAGYNFLIFSFPSSSWLFRLFSSVIMRNKPCYSKISSKNRRFDEKRAPKTTSAGTHREALYLDPKLWWRANNHTVNKFSCNNRFWNDCKSWNA